MKLVYSLFISLVLLCSATIAHAGRVYVQRIAGADVPADNAWRTMLTQTFSVAVNTSGTVLVTIPFLNQSCTGNSTSCSPTKMAAGQVRVSLRDSTGYLHDQETVWIENAVSMNPPNALTSILVRNSGPYTLHLAAADMRPATYTVTVELMAVGGATYRPLRYNGIKSTVQVN